MRICSGSGCLRVVADEVRYCADCQPQLIESDGIREHSQSYDEILDRLRKSFRWQRTRERVIREQPMCARCDLRISEIGDHIVPAREAIAQCQASGKYPGDQYHGYFIRSNIQGLCRKCHYDKTLEDKLHVGPWPDVMRAAERKPKRWSF